MFSKLVLKTKHDIQNKIHLDPDLVTTVVPGCALPLIGDVVTGAPSSNPRPPEITPVIEPSRFTFQFDRRGTPRGALEADFAETVGVSPESSESDLPPPNPNKLIVTPLMFASKAMKEKRRVMIQGWSQHFAICHIKTGNFKKSEDRHFVAERCLVVVVHLLTAALCSQF